MSRAREGFVPVSGGRVWYRIVGDGAGIPLLLIHGGPGVPHDYLEPLGALGDDRPVVFYDQLGCGRSDRPDDPGLWRLERFVAEAAQLRAALGLERVHILGQSWGTILATEYLLGKPSGVASVVMANPCVSVPKYLEDLERLCADLPAAAREVIARAEAQGDTETPEYQIASFEFYRRHVCRLQTWPEALNRSVAGMGAQPYLTMWGANEFTCTGNLREYDGTAGLREIAIPTLFLAGRFDETTPESTAWYQSLVPGSELAIFENSSHMPQLEEPARYLSVVRDFLRRAERRHTG
ncbi:MAG TPA: proline iminopeptidase-family hydrolase [Candidatus Binataceae bacterium]|nr:proline iminopeptidase-family hydrolase [Candidatus Binataceae bacterium]